jgi:hypothetical protein
MINHSQRMRWDLILGLLLLIGFGDIPISSQLVYQIIKDPAGQAVCYYATSQALLIGMSAYTNGWPELSSVPEELAQVKEVLTQHGFYVTTALNLTARELEHTITQFIDFIEEDTQEPIHG